MKRTFFLFLGASMYCSSYGQKPVLQLNSYKSWPEVTTGDLSNNGKYAFYQIRNYPVSQNTFVLKSTTGKELLSLLNLSDAKFSKNSRYLIGKLPNDTLFIYNLPKRSQKKIAGIGSYELLMIGKQEKLIWKGINESFNVSDFNGNQVYSWTKVNQYKFSPTGHKLLIEQQDTGTPKKVICRWIDTATGKEKLIYEGASSSNVIFDGEGEQAAFIVNIDGGNSIYYYKEGLDTAIVLADQNSAGIENGLAIETGEYWAFSKDGERIFFSLKENITKNKTENPNLEIWSYEDAYLRSFYNGNRGNEIKERHYLSTVSLNAKNVKQLIYGKQRIVGNSLKFNTDTLFLVQSSFGVNTEEWNPNSRASYYLCFTKTGKLVPLEINRSKAILTWNVSPNGKYVVYFDPVKQSYIAYDCILKNKINISEAVTAKFTEYYRLHYPNPEEYPVGIIGWLKNDEALLVNTTYDVWKLDPTGISQVKNMTNWVGEKTKTVFFPANEKRGETISSDKLLLSAFNTQTKDYGFYELDAVGNQGLQLLSMASRYTGDLDVVYTQLNSVDFLIAKNKKGYLLRWQKTDQFPNYFYSKDLKTFKTLSDVQPQKGYNWLTAELCNYKDSLGNTYQGIVYKPEDFDPKKKYPIIFNIYETKSNQLNTYYNPELVGADFNIPLLVSNGYLVFLPDIRGEIKYSGDAALRSIVSATDYVSQFPWVDTKKMAVVGHSVGGFETNFIITHCNKFAAAISGAGVSNMINVATDLWGSGENRQWFAQNSAYMTASPLNDDLDTYIRNSPMLQAKQLNTPVLFMHNDGDHSVNVQQTQSFFIVLRSLQKTAWWLKYKGQGHGVTGEKNQLDFNIKVWSFLDYYLKDKPMPEWMKEHI
ncbi:Dipeptidyl aminopeptidase/acylaminoacyl peptidase [Chitinophaga sp. CF118]|uniref:alpha/beta hydrolase family protein n=1 Tax=Chitinophaga sp. CF118 TaxID=1884367 RepID=UPI0008E903BE|nr:prolyl oligopeptidase family serine peptidase [Chitinophaga sp. CF118]SFF06947.1 Dipeptidyl aminopeptidase/acylaminoacyl peptidase [Chitinophaga sp. CF118]